MESATPVEVIRLMPDAEIAREIDIIEENLQVVGSRSSYAARNRPLLKSLRIEAERRGI